MLHRDVQELLLQPLLFLFLPLLLLLLFLLLTLLDPPNPLFGSKWGLEDPA